MDEKLKSEIIAYAKSQEPHEMCGFVVLKRGENQPHFLPCENMAEDKENHFEISPDDYLKAESMGEILALVHSHPNGKPALSQADLQTQLYSQLDFWLVCDGQIHLFPKIPLLIGREFEHGKMDCYTLYRDFYRLAGYEMTEYARDDYWWEDGFNLYLDNIEKEGFERITDQHALQIGDVILIQVGADVPNHAAIYIGDQMVLHHAPKRLSKRDLYDGYWFKHTHSMWRHKLADNRTYDVKGIKVKVPSNYDPKTRQYRGMWDGTFKLAWSDNPAWVLYDVVTNKRYGLNIRIVCGDINSLIVLILKRF